MQRAGQSIRSSQMTIHRSRVLLIAFFFALTFTSTSNAAERRFWSHDGGHFENINGGQWQEKTPDGPCHFVEKERTEKFIELYDKSRECSVRLFENHCEVK